VSAIFKCVVHKANRTSLTSFRGPGLDEGLRILADMRANAPGWPLLTEILEPGAGRRRRSRCRRAGKIPAFLSRRPTCSSGRAHWQGVNVKKGQFSRRKT